MADPTQKISEMTEADLPLDGTEDIEIVQSGVTRRCSTQDVADLAGGVGEVVTVKVSLSSAEILALNGTPKELIAAPGSGKIIQPIATMYRYNYGTLTYNTNQTMQLYYNGFVGNTITNTLLSRTESAILRQGAISTTSLTYLTATQDIVNKAFMLSVQTGNPAAGDGTLDVYITYTIITL